MESAITKVKELGKDDNCNLGTLSSQHHYSSGSSEYGRLFRKNTSISKGKTDVFILMCAQQVYGLEWLT